MFEELTAKLEPFVIFIESVPIVPRVPSFVTRIFELARMRGSVTSMVPPTRVAVPVFSGKYVISVDEPISTIRVQALCLVVRIEGRISASINQLFPLRDDGDGGRCGPSYFIFDDERSPYTY